ncbi:MAG: heterodisulfide reductase-related iron-sulfur binding cluster [Deltaproteobacteria bacterium]|nr:heterodisulfide reductase-related iron-sulfur binding cluster [Deltaproteobacteria bacterium]
MMHRPEVIDISYFPGCSLATTAKENNQSLIEVCKHMGYRLVELKDWNCCGSSSAHSIKSEMGFQLSCRNLSLAPKGIPLLVACPSCILHLKQAHRRLITDTSAMASYEARWGRLADQDLKIMHFFELMNSKNNVLPDLTLNGLKFVPYYGCMLARPPELRHEENYHGLMEKLLSAYGASPMTWNYASRCCGTFLSVARPDVVEPMVNEIVQNAMDSGAECLITACAMCHLNLEIRCSLKQKIPIFHFSEILSLAFQIRPKTDWFARHLIDPAPLLKSRMLITY